MKKLLIGILIGLGFTATIAFASSVFIVQQGGTGQGSVTNDALLYGSSTNQSLNILPIGSTGQVLTVVSGKPAWAAATGSTASILPLIANGTVAGVNATSSTVSFNVRGSGTLNPFNVASSSGTSEFQVLANGNVEDSQINNGSIMIGGASGLLTNSSLSQSAGTTLINGATPIIDGGGDWLNNVIQTSGANVIVQTATSTAVLGNLIQSGGVQYYQTTANLTPAQFCSGGLYNVASTVPITLTFPTLTQIGASPCGGSQPIASQFAAQYGVNSGSSTFTLAASGTGESFLYAPGSGANLYPGQTQFATGQFIATSTISGATTTGMSLNAYIADFQPTSTSPSTMGQILAADQTGHGWALTNLVAGSNVTITTSTPGSITIASSGSGSGNSAFLFGSGLIYNATSTDSVLIGTSTPTTAQFEIQGSGTKIPLVVASSSGTSYLQVAANGSTTISSLTAGDVFSTSGGALYVNGNTGTGLNVLQTSPTLITPILGTASGTALSLSGNLWVIGNSALATTTVSQLSLGDGLTNSILAVDPNGKVIATTTSAGGVTAVNGAGSIVSSGGSTPTIQLQNLTTNDILFGQGNSTIATSSNFTFTTGTNNLTVTNASTTVTTNGTLFVTGQTTLATASTTALSDSGKLFVTGSTTLSSLGAGCVNSTSGGGLYSASCATGGGVTGSGTSTEITVWNSPTNVSGYSDFLWNDASTTLFFGGGSTSAAWTFGTKGNIAGNGTNDTGLISYIGNVNVFPDQVNFIKSYFQIFNDTTGKALAIGTDNLTTNGQTIIQVPNEAGTFALATAGVTGKCAQWSDANTLTAVSGACGPGGSNGQVQYNNSGSFSGAASLLENSSVVGVNATSSTVDFNIQGISGSTNVLFNVASSSGTSYLQVAANGSTTISSLNTGGIVQSTASGALYNSNVALASEVSGILPQANGGNGFGTCALSAASATSTATDTGTCSIFTKTLTGNITSLLISGFATGKTYLFQLTQDGTGGRTVSGATNIITFPSQNTASGTINSFYCTYDGSNCNVISATNNGGLSVVPYGSALPGTPSTGLYVTNDPTQKRTIEINDSGVTFGYVKDISVVSNDFLTSIVNGVPTQAQPSFSNLSGSSTAIQLPTGTQILTAAPSIATSSISDNLDCATTGGITAGYVNWATTVSLPAFTQLPGAGYVVNFIGIASSTGTTVAAQLQLSASSTPLYTQNASQNTAISANNWAMHVSFTLVSPDVTSSGHVYTTMDSYGPFSGVSTGEYNNLGAVALNTTIPYTLQLGMKCANSTQAFSFTIEQAWLTRIY